MKENMDKHILEQEEEELFREQQRQIEKRWMNRAVIGAVLAIIGGILILCQTVF